MHLQVPFDAGENLTGAWQHKCKGGNKVTFNNLPASLISGLQTPYSLMQYQNRCV